MRLHRFVVLPLVFLAGCHLTAPAPSDVIAADRKALPPNTVSLSDMMRTLNERPGFTDRLLTTLNQGEKQGALLTPDLFDQLRKLLLGKDWGGLDRFPGWTSSRITRSVNLIGKLVSHNAPPATTEQVKQYLDLGPYSLESAQTVSLDAPSTLPGFTAETKSLGEGVVMGDGADPKLAPLHAESQRLADVMNRLSMNGGNSAAFAATIGGRSATTPEELITALAATGHTVLVADSRYFANFGHLHLNGQDVQMPFWMDSQWQVPTEHWWQRSRHLLVPVAHAEYEWIISGPKVNADVTFYFGIDGKAEFRTNDLLNQPWVMGRHAHEYRAKDALEVTRLTGHFVRAYSVLHAAHPDLPFGGYYALGVCQDSVGAIEMRMTGKTTLFPNTAKTEFFHDQPDAEITQLMEAVPKDTGNAPEIERIFGSLPTTDFAHITVPGLSEDVQRSYAAWQEGELSHSTALRTPLSVVGVILATLILVAVFRRRVRTT